MNPRSSSRLSLLLLGLMALMGCQPATITSIVSVNVTVPLESPEGSVLRLRGENPSFLSEPLAFQGGNTFSGRLWLNKGQPATFHVQLDAPVAQQALDAAGAALPSTTFTPHADTESVDISVERWGQPGAAQGAQTVFVVEAPDNTPAGAALWLSGNQPELGNWGGGDVPLTHVLANRYTATLSFAAGTSLEFKVTRGTWDSVEKSDVGAEVENHTWTTSGGFERVVVTVGGWADLNKPPPPVHTLTGNIKYHHVTPKDTTLKERDLIVWLPPGYDDAGNTSTYPVLYMHDGQNLMDAATAFSGEWGVDETAQDLVTKGEVRPLIIVGVYNTADRIPEYTEAPDPAYPDGGRAPAYGKFLVNEVKPLIDSTYRTQPGPEFTGLAGSSLGGLVSMYLGMQYPDTFRRLGVVSPSVWWDNRDIVSLVQKLPAKLPLTIWEDIGTNEGTSAQSETVADAQALHDALVAKGWADSTEIKLTIDPGAQHSEKYWSARFPNILRFLYPPLTSAAQVPSPDRARGGSMSAATSRP